MRGKWLKVSTSSKKRTKPHSTRLRMFGVYQRHPRRNPVKENLWLTPSRLSRKDLNSAELDTIGYSETLQGLSQPTVKCKQAKKQQCMSTALICLRLRPPTVGALVYRGCPCRDPPVWPPIARQHGIGTKRQLCAVLVLASSWHAHEMSAMTVQILEETSAVLSLGKLCQDHGYSYEWASGQKPHLILKR